MGCPPLAGDLGGGKNSTMKADKSNYWAYNNDEVMVNMNRVVEKIENVIIKLYKRFERKGCLPLHPLLGGGHSPESLYSSVGGSTPPRRGTLSQLHGCSSDGNTLDPRLRGCRGWKKLTHTRVFSYPSSTNKS